MNQELWNVIPADMDTGLSMKSVDPDVDYEEFTEDRIQENPTTGRERKGSRFLVPEHRTKGKDAPVTSSSAGRALTDDEKRRRKFAVAED
ncbi:hypothetical protein E4U14_000986 [Claviceps sp. LM454 group G7]|nr:hypothetical protein E4U14_000986 [Claviceps sp. LM454 group G7]